MSDLTVFIAPAIALLLSVVLTPLIRIIAQSRGWMANPTGDRWHDTPTALYGGIAMAAGVAAAAVFLLYSGFSNTWFWLGAAIISTLGFIDDRFHLSPTVRVLVEVLAAILVVIGGFGISGSPVLAGLITVIWIVLVSNAINLIDGADGVASSVVGVTSLIAGLLLLNFGNTEVAIIAFVLSAVSFGFLTYNFPPAKIFMGDGGSLLLGFLLAVVSLEVGRSLSENSSLFQLAVAFSFVAVPFLDAVFVALVRILVGSNPAHGGTHHIHHRLRLAGLSPIQTTVGLATLAAVFALTARIATSQPSLFIAIGCFAVMALVLLELLLVQQTGFLPSKDGETAERRSLIRAGKWLKTISPWPKVVADGVILGTSFILATFLASGQQLVTTDYLTAVVLAIAVKITIMWVFGLYKSMWLTTIGTPDLVRVLAAVFFGAAGLSAVASFLPHLQLGGREITIDLLATSIGLIGVRVGYRAFRNMLAGQNRTGRRAIMYGAGEAGSIAVREMRLNPARHLNPIGFIDDDPLKQENRVYGLKVFGDSSQLERIVELHAAEEVVICSQSIGNKSIHNIQNRCNDLGIVCSTMTFDFRDLPASNSSTVAEIEPDLY